MVLPPPPAGGGERASGASNSKQRKGQMKAFWYERCGPATEVLSLGEQPAPSAGPGEVRIKLEASGVNPADVGRRAGNYRGLEFPLVIPNSDGAGIIDQVGDGVTRLKLGQRVWLFN